MTMVFQNCCPKHPNGAFLASGISFLFGMKLYVFTNLRVLIKDFTIAFIKLHLKFYVFLDQTVHVNKFEDADFKYDVKYDFKYIFEVLA